MATYTKTPRITKARQNTNCHETGKLIKKGADCWLNVKTGHFFTVDSIAAKTFKQNLNLVYND